MATTLIERSDTTTSIALEETSCLLCGANEFAFVLHGRDPLGGQTFQVMRCIRCGLRYTNPRPTPETIGQYYPAQYRPHARAAKHQRPLRSWYPFDWLKATSRSGRRPRLLDFGCGAGHFLAAMDRAGWEVTGLDVSQAAIESIREHVGLAAFAGSLPHDELEPARFDCITMWHSLEHVHDPLRIAREARRLLVPGGRLIVAVPNFASWSRRHFGASWFGLDLPRHLTHFDQTTLSRLLESAGFRIDGVRFPRHADWIRSSAQRANDSGYLSRRFAAEIASRFWIRSNEADALMILAERV